MQFSMRSVPEKILDFDVVEGSYAYNSSTEYFRDWDEILRNEQEGLIKLRNELEAVFLKAMRVGKAS